GVVQEDDRRLGRRIRVDPGDECTRDRRKIGTRAVYVVRDLAGERSVQPGLLATRAKDGAKEARIPCGATSATRLANGRSECASPAEDPVPSNGTNRRRRMNSSSRRPACGTM